MKKNPRTCELTSPNKVDRYAELVALPQVDRLRLLRESRGGTPASALIIRARVIVRSIESDPFDQER